MRTRPFLFSMWFLTTLGGTGASTRGGAWISIPGGCGLKTDHLYLADNGHRIRFHGPVHDEDFQAHGGLRRAVLPFVWVTDGP